MRKWFNIKADTTSAARIDLFDGIGAFGISAAQFVRELKAVSAKSIDLHINSPGGDVSDSIAIYNSLRAHPARIIAHIDGLAASGASVVMLAGDEVRMASNAMVMIHEASGMTLGTSGDHAQTAGILEKMNDQIAGIYHGRTGIETREHWRALMAAETWFDADEAMEAGLCGFVDDFSQGIKAAAHFNLSGFKNVPLAVKSPAEHAGKLAIAAGKVKVHQNAPGVHHFAGPVR